MYLSANVLEVNQNSRQFSIRAYLPRKRIRAVNAESPLEVGTK